MTARCFKFLRVSRVAVVISVASCFLATTPGFAATAAPSPSADDVSSTSASVRLLRQKQQYFLALIEATTLMAQLKADPKSKEVAKDAIDELRLLQAATIYDLNDQNTALELLRTLAEDKTSKQQKPAAMLGVFWGNPSLATSLKPEALARLQAWTVRDDSAAFADAIQRSETQNAYSAMSSIGNKSPLTQETKRNLSDLQLKLKRERPYSPAAAAWMSVFVPGLGQAYAGAYQSAAIAFTLNAIFLATAIENFRNDRPATGIAASAVFSITYVGNITGAYSVAANKNELARTEIDRSIKTLLLPELSF